MNSSKTILKDDFQTESIYTNIEENVDQFFAFSKKAVKETIHKKQR